MYISSLKDRLPFKNIFSSVFSNSWIPSSSFADISIIGISRPRSCSASISFDTTVSRSVLFNRIIAFLSSTRFRIFWSFSSNDRDASTTYITRSALFAYSFAFSTPIFSITSSVSRIPAVSMIFRLSPCRWICSSKTSLVVPSMSVTMALSLPESTFNKEDFPAFGFPTITVWIPSFKILPSSDDRMRSSSSLKIPSVTVCSVSPYPSTLICSGSSSAVSINAV